MTMLSLSSCIIRSLKEGEMVQEISLALLARNRSQALNKDENEYWDYKEKLTLDNPLEIANLAKDILGFHNAKGGLIIVGIRDDFDVVGVPKNQVLDTVSIHSKIRKYTGPSVLIFQNSIELFRDRVLWLIFIPRREGAPVAVAANGPEVKGKPIIRRNEYYVRIADQTLPCREPNDFERLFTGVNMDHLQAYLYDVDEPFFRLLAPHCERFVGRYSIIQQVIEALESRHPVVSLDGVGGVGKSAIAIELVRQLYGAQRYLFIISLSAKMRVWQGYTTTRRAGFSGLTEFLQEIGRVLQIGEIRDSDELKRQIIETMKGLQGLLLVDNIEDIQDPGILKFISMELPDPVKCLVTSRIDRGLGALSVAIPEMNDEEARQLLLEELQRVGYSKIIHEISDIPDLLRITQHLPLAIKWATGLVLSGGSLKEAISQLRRSTSTKQEFLNFCFATMFDKLPKVVRDAALLCPYLGEDWNPSSVSLALDVSEPDAQRAFDDLKDRGIVFLSSSAKEGALSILPLTSDFLLSRWHENAVLREQVSKRLAAALGTRDTEGLLFKLPKVDRAPIVRQRVESLMKTRDLKTASRVIRLGLKWSSGSDLRFLEGQVLYESGQVSDGISYMSIALGVLRQEGRVSVQHLWVLGEALLRHGGSDGQREGLDLIEDAVQMTGELREGLVEQFLRVAIELLEFKSISRMAAKVRTPDGAYRVAKFLLPVLDRKDLLDQCGFDLLAIFLLAPKSEEASFEEGIVFRDAYKQIRGFAEGKPARVRA